MDKKNIKNLKEFKALIKKYRSITPMHIDISCNEVVIINGNVFDGTRIAFFLTGFGKISSCTLCIAINKRSVFSDCDGCVYDELTVTCCYRGNNKETYNSIKSAKNSKQLLKAFRDRADYMENLLIKNELIKPKAKPVKK